MVSRWAIEGSFFWVRLRKWQGVVKEEVKGDVENWMGVIDS
jgi:hypothetical protein